MDPAVTVERPAGGIRFARVRRERDAPPDVPAPVREVADDGSAAERVQAAEAVKGVTGDRTRGAVGQDDEAACDVDAPALRAADGGRAAELVNAAVAVERPTRGRTRGRPRRQDDLARDVEAGPVGEPGDRGGAAARMQPAVTV